jgi:hypothetical protein
MDKAHFHLQFNRSGIRSQEFKRAVTCQLPPPAIMMDVMLQTGVDSFIVRFVQEKGQSDGTVAAPWHGVIRHVQSKEEIRFTHIEDALRFVANYVELDEDKPPDNNFD